MLRRSSTALLFAALCGCGDSLYVGSTSLDGGEPEGGAAQEGGEPPWHDPQIVSLDQAIQGSWYFSFRDPRPFVPPQEYSLQLQLTSEGAGYGSAMLTCSPPGCRDMRAGADASIFGSWDVPADFFGTLLSAPGEYWVLKAEGEHEGKGVMIVADFTVPFVVDVRPNAKATLRFIASSEFTRSRPPAFKGDGGAP